MNVNDVNGNIFLTPQSLSPYCAGVCGACVVMLCNIHSEPVLLCNIRPKSNHYMFTLSGSQIFQNPWVVMAPLPEICGQLNWGSSGSSVQLTLGLAQGPASGDVQHAIDGRGPAAQVLHGGQQAFHLRSQCNMSFEQIHTNPRVGLVYRSSPLCIFYRRHPVGCEEIQEQ